MPGFAFLAIHLLNDLPVHIWCCTTIFSIMTAQLFVWLYSENQESDPLKITPPFLFPFFPLHKIFSPISSQSSSTCDSMKHLYWHTEKNSSERRGKISIKSFNIAKELLSLTMAKNAGLVV